MPMTADPEEVMAAWWALGPNPSREAVGGWLARYFAAAGTDVHQWVPLDWTATPSRLLDITDPTYREWALAINAIWKELGKEIDQSVLEHPSRHSLLAAPHPWIAPGGRFREFYAWDSYWIIAGLLHSGMHNTSRLMLENLLWTISKLGFVPNGARVYYTRRAQPPMLSLMVARYVGATGDTAFLDQALPLLDAEHDWWMQNSSVVLAGGLVLNRYIAGSSVPRPEGYNEDVAAAKSVPAAERPALFRNLASAAESGWDFSSRWMRDANSSALSETITSSVVPVDLNSIMFAVEKTLARFHALLGHTERAQLYSEAAARRAKAIHALLWNDVCSVWTDCVLSDDDESHCQRRGCNWYPSNMMPLWSGAFSGFVDPAAVVKAAISSGMLSLPGGVPASAVMTDLQWDWPQAWPPCEWFVVESLKAAGFAVQARQLAEVWLKSNYEAWVNFGHKMFEKYDCRQSGMPGDSGEYDVQLGFGWTNGVVLDFLVQYHTA